MLSVSNCRTDKQTHKKSLPPAITSGILKVCLSNFTGLTVMEFRTEMLRVRPSVIAFICAIITIVLLSTSIKRWRRGVPGVTYSYE